jgi:YHS domain-containing protein
MWKLCSIAILSCAAVFAQMPGSAVELDKVKISEAVKPIDLDPVTLKPSDPAQPTWEYKGVTYRGSVPESKEKFLSDPDRYAKAAEKQRYILNFMKAMSTIWCPVTDQVTPGGMMQWDYEGLKFESCCAFCDENGNEKHFAKGLEKLKERAELTYNLVGAKYTEGARSPVEGAIKKKK